MPKFFVEEVKNNCYILGGEEAKHIIKSLRMKVGENLTLCDNCCIDHFCKIEKIQNDEVFLQIISSEKSKSEPPTKISLYQGIPKADKMDLIVQKCVETGVFEIIPVFMNRCISLPDEKSMKKKTERWNKISKEAAKQSGRGLIPSVLPALSFKDAVQRAKKTDQLIAFFENGGEPIKKTFSPDSRTVSLFIGPEGGFEQSEIDFIIKNNGFVSTLGPRILRTETAAIVATALISEMSESYSTEP